jgi:hypothetical protein
MTGIMAAMICPTIILQYPHFSALAERVRARLDGVVTRAMLLFSAQNRELFPVAMALAHGLLNATLSNLILTGGLGGELAKT